MDHEKKEQKKSIFPSEVVVGMPKSLHIALLGDEAEIENFLNKAEIKQGSSGRLQKEVVLDRQLGDGFLTLNFSRYTLETLDQVESEDLHMLCIFHNFAASGSYDDAVKILTA